MATRQMDELDTLMLQAGKGDEAAFRRFYDAAAPAINAFLLRLLKDRYLAEDVLQEAMVVAWNRADEFDPELAAAKTWITTIARRRALDLLRNQRRREEILDESTGDIRSVLALENSESTIPESDATAKRLALCFSELRSEAATCIQFAYLDGMTLREIALRIDRSLNTIKSWVRRGLTQLKTCMQP